MSPVRVSPETTTFVSTVAAPTYWVRNVYVPSGMSPNRKVPSLAVCARRCNSTISTSALCRDLMPDTSATRPVKEAANAAGATQDPATISAVRLTGVDQIPRPSARQFASLTVFTTCFPMRDVRGALCSRAVTVALQLNDSCETPRRARHHFGKRHCHDAPSCNYHSRPSARTAGVAGRSLFDPMHHASLR